MLFCLFALFCSFETGFGFLCTVLAVLELTLEQTNLNLMVHLPPKCWGFKVCTTIAWLQTVLLTSERLLQPLFVETLVFSMHIYFLRVLLQSTSCLFLFCFFETGSHYIALDVLEPLCRQGSRDSVATKG